MRTVVASIEGEFRRYRTLAEKAMAQLDEAGLARRFSGTDNSIGTIAWHVGGNLRSRFTDFLTTDGEKPWRDRDSEFAERTVSKDELLAHWNRGWDVLMATLASLSDDDLAKTVTIRETPLSVLEALHRSLAHCAYHAGQIVFVAKSLRGGEWNYLSIPPGQSAEYAKHPTLEKPPAR